MHPALAPSVPQDHQPIFYAAASYRSVGFTRRKKPSKNGLIKVVPPPSLEAKKKSKKGQEPLPALKSLSRVMSPRSPQPLPKEGWPASPTCPRLRSSRRAPEQVLRKVFVSPRLPMLAIVKRPELDSASLQICADRRKFANRRVAFGPLSAADDLPMNTGPRL